MKGVLLAFPALAAFVAFLATSFLACGASRSGSGTEQDAAPDAPLLDGSVEATTTGVGVVTFSEYPDAGGKFFAGFTETPPDKATTCSIVDAGQCTTTSCPPAAHDAGGDAAASDATAPAPNPGTLKLTGGAFGATGITVAPDKGGTYLYQSPRTLFAAGDTLSVSALGGELPPFSEQSVTALPALELSAPVADGGKIAIQTSQPLTVSWTGGQAGATFVFSATAVFTTGGVATMTCGWDASSNAASVPTSALKPLAVENATTSGVGWYQATSDRFAVGGVGVTMTAYIAQQVLASFE